LYINSRFVTNGSLKSRCLCGATKTLLAEECKVPLSSDEEGSFYQPINIHNYISLSGFNAVFRKCVMWYSSIRCLLFEQVGLMLHGGQNELFSGFFESHEYKLNNISN
jgi:hypothetical protein